MNLAWTNWIFIARGIFHGGFMLVERAGLRKMLKYLPEFIGCIYTIVMVLIGWGLFRADGIRQTFICIKSMFVST